MVVVAVIEVLSAEIVAVAIVAVVEIAVKVEIVEMSCSLSRAQI